MGWWGETRQLLWTLRVVGADRDEQGNFRVGGEIASLMGLGKELVVGDDAVYFVGGEPRNLAALMASTSYGVPVRAIFREGGAERARRPRPRRREG